ncbi:MAG: uroporphyrinogen-III synthase [Alphaproteobacteria bacterium]
MRSVLVTRPQPAADELAEKLRREGFEVYLAPMTEYVDTEATVPDLGGYQGLIFTSAQAVGLFAQDHAERSPVVFAVGDATAQAASKAGFHRVYSAQGSGDDVANLIRSKKNDLHIRKVLHLCGEDTAQDLQPQLDSDGIAVDRVPIYKARFMEALPADVGRALAEGDVSTVTLFSARTAANFARLMRQQDLKGVSADLEAVCLSDRVAAEIRELPWRVIRIAKNPHLESVLDILRAKEEGRSANAPLPADPVIEAFGGLRPLANRLDITASTVQGWKKRGVIPETRVDSVIEAARAANIDLDSLWTQGGIAMSDDDKSSSGSSSAGGTPPKPQQTGNFQDRRRSTDRRQKRAVVDKRGVVHADGYTGPERRAGVDRRSYEQRQYDRIAKEKWRFFNRSVVTGALLSIAILYAGAFLLAPEFFEVKSEAKKIKEMQAQMDAINKRMAQMQAEKQTSLGSQLSNRIGEFQDTVQTIKSTASAVSTVAQSVAQNTEAGKALQQLINVLSTLNKLNATTGGRKAVDASMEKLKAIMAVTGADPEKLNAAIAEARKSDPTLDKVFGNVEPKDLGAAALLLALNEYRDDVSAGRPFQNDLAVLRKFAGNDPELQKALDRLAPYAESGVLSRTRLQKEFQGLASDIVMSRLKGQDLSAKEEALKRLSTLVKVRKIDDIEGTGVDATVARAQWKLDHGDVKGAIQDLQTLDGAPAQTAQPFINQASGTLMADDTASAMTQVILQQIQERTGFDLQSLFQNVTSQWGGGGGGAAPYISPGAQGVGGGAVSGPSEE